MHGRPPRPMSACMSAKYFTAKSAARTGLTSRWWDRRSMKSAASPRCAVRSIANCWRHRLFGPAWTPQGGATSSPPAAMRCAASAARRISIPSIPTLPPTRSPPAATSAIWRAKALVAANQFYRRRSAGPQRLRTVADHVRLPRQRDRGRYQDHRRLGAEDRHCQIKTGLGAVESADDGADEGPDRACAVAHDVDRGYPPQQPRRGHRLAQGRGRDHPQDRTDAEQEEAQP